MTEARQEPGHHPTATPVELETVDPELLALPAPPRGQRAVALSLMLAVVLGAVAFIAQIRPDIAYFFASDVAVDLGQARTSKTQDLPTNAFVRLRGTPMLSKMITYTVPLTGAQRAVFPLLGQSHVFVEVPLDQLRDPDQGPRGEFFGRLVTFGLLRGRLRAVQHHLHDAMDLPVTGESFVLMADEAPDSYLWAPLLGLLCLAFIGLSLAMVVRWFRPLSIRSEAPVTRLA